MNGNGYNGGNGKSSEDTGIESNWNAINLNATPRKVFKKFEKAYLRAITMWNKFLRENYVDYAKTYDYEKKFALLNAVGLLHEFLQKDYPPGWKDQSHGINNYKKNPIVLLHGYGQNRGAFTDMAGKLREHGFAMVYRLNHNPWTDIKKNIKYINSRIDHILAQTNPESGKVDLIGHSLGGLTSRYYSYLYPEKVDYCLMLGAPHNGTYVAYLGLLGFIGNFFDTKIEGMSAYQMTPNSKFLKEINAMKPSSTVKYINIYTNTDEVILREESEIVNGYLNIDTKVDAGIEGVGHTGLIHDPRIIDLICDILNDTYGKQDSFRFYEDYDDEYKRMIPIRERVVE